MAAFRSLHCRSRWMERCVKLRDVEWRIETNICKIVSCALPPTKTTKLHQKRGNEARMYGFALRHLCTSQLFREPLGVIKRSWTTDEFTPVPSHLLVEGRVCFRDRIRFFQFSSSTQHNKSATIRNIHVYECIYMCRLELGARTRSRLFRVPSSRRCQYSQG